MILQDQTEICPVHNIDFKKEWVFIHYGLMRFSKEFDDYNEARKKLFPYSYYYVGGVCGVDSNNLIVEMKYCSACRKNQLNWSYEHKSTYGLPYPRSYSQERVKSIMLGNDKKIKIDDQGILDQLRTLSLLDAVKLLKSKNPSVTVTTLKKHIQYLQVKADIEDKIQYHDEVEELLQQLNK